MKASDFKVEKVDMSIFKNNVENKLRFDGGSIYFNSELVKELPVFSIVTTEHDVFLTQSADGIKIPKNKKVSNVKLVEFIKHKYKITEAQTKFNLTVEKVVVDKKVYYKLVSN